MSLHHQHPRCTTLWPSAGSSLGWCRIVHDGGGIAVANRDPGWRAFSYELKSAMALNQVSVEDLAYDLGQRVGSTVSRDKVVAWRATRSTPPLAYLPHIADLTRMGAQGSVPASPSLYLAERMGIIGSSPDSSLLIDAAYRLQKLEAKILDSQMRVARADRSDSLQELIQAVLSSQGWSVNIMAEVVELSEGCEFHVADRLDLRGPSRSGTQVDEVLQVDQLRRALRGSYAALVDPRIDPPSQPSESYATRWRIPRLGRPTSPQVSRPHPRLRSVAVTSVTGQAQPDMVAALIALSLGYGLTTTNNLAMTELGFHPAAALPRERWSIHSRLLHEPPKRRTWSHYGMLDEEPLFRSDKVPGHTFVVWLRESDALLQRARPDADEVVVAKSQRAVMEPLLRDAPPNVLMVELEDHDDPHLRFQASATAAVRTLQTLIERGYVSEESLKQVWPSVVDVHRELGDAWIAWLRGNLSL